MVSIDMRNRDILDEGMTLEEGSIPAPIRFLLKSSLLPLSRLFGVDTDRNFKDKMREKWREVQSFFRGVYYGAVNNTQVYLVMTHDDGNGVMGLEHDRICIQWKGVGKQKIFQKVSESLKRATQALGGNFLKNPTWTKIVDYDLVTVHPLGGCIMGKDAAAGVVDHKGQVFSGNSGKELHSGLYVLDGAIIPRSVGTNPLLTISGLAERSCNIIAKEMGITLDYAFPEIPKKEAAETPVGVQFTETMTGYFSLTEKEDYKKAYEQGKEANSPFEFTLTIHVQDAERFVEDPDHEAGMIGTVMAPALSGHPLSTSGGKFNLFVTAPDEPGRKKMKYEMLMHAA
jgi:cholesterol oxidase